MHCDTDTLIYIQPKGDGLPLIKTGHKLGDMTFELRSSGSISEYVCGGPNDVRVKAVDGDVREKTVCKVRGITLNYNVSKMVNFDVIRDMILKTNERPSVVNVHTENKMKRKRARFATVAIVTETENKIYRISYFKGRRFDENTFVTFG